MIKILAVQPQGERTLELQFSDGSRGCWSGEELIARDTVLTRPLTDPAYFSRAFVESGALAWPNGLELSPQALHGRMMEAGLLTKRAA